MSRYDVKDEYNVESQRDIKLTSYNMSSTDEPLGRFRGSNNNGSLPTELNGRLGSATQVNGTVPSDHEESASTSCGSWMDKRLKSMCRRKLLYKRIPILEWLPKYRKEYIVSDIVAGVTVGLTVIPQAIAYANVAGLPLQYGLYSSFMSCFIYTVFGSCKDVPVGPTAIAAIMTHEALDKAHLPPIYAVLLAFVSGCVSLLMGVLQLGGTMSDSDSFASFDSDGTIKCATPPKSKTKFIDKGISLKSDSSSDSDSSESESDLSSRSPSPRRPFVEFNRFEHYDKSDDEDDKYRTEIAHTQEISLKIRYCQWSISDFSMSPLNKEGFINSKIYTAGVANEFQWFFRIERFKQKSEVYYGVYVCIITHNESQAKMDFRAYITELRGHSYRLATSKNFPKKEGMDFLGFMRKSHVRDDDYWYYRMIPDDRLTLTFRIHVQLKKFKNTLVDNLKDIWKSKKYTDAALVVKGEEIPVHKTILAARSSVFAEIFKDNNSSRVHIDDFEPEVMKEFLRYIYTGRIKKLIKHLKDYSAAAKKYQIEELREICDKTTKFYTS